MADEPRILDEEVLLRRVPPGPSWIKENRPRSGNFALKPGETGISVSRSAITQPWRLLRLIGNPPGWRIATITASEVRQLGLDVIPSPTEEDDPGHAEIVPAERGLSHSVRRSLAEKCRLLPEAEHRPQS